MELLDFIPEEFILDHFDQMNRRTMAFLPPNVSIALRFVNSDDLRIYATSVPGDEGAQCYEIRVSRHLVEFVTRYLFAVARCVDTINGHNIPDPQPSGLPRRWFPDVERMEALLNALPSDLQLHGERVSLFLAIFAEAWDLLLFHETAHITEGHLRFKDEHPERFDDPIYSRSCELEADDRANRWLRDRATALDYPWITGEGTGSGAYGVDPKFTVIVVSILFLSLRVGATTFGEARENYLPLGTRHMLTVIQLLQHESFDATEDLFEAVLYAMTESLRILDLVMDWPQRPISTLVIDVPLERQGELVSAALADHERLRGEWLPYRPGR
ncbi:hypothetical protein J2W92_002347 [Rhizobium leguminosarum]